MCVCQVVVDLLITSRQVDADAAARQRDEGEAPCRQQISERPGARSETRKNVCSKLDPAESERGDVVDRLEVLAAPCDGGVTDFGGRGEREEGRGNNCKRGERGR